MKKRASTTRFHVLTSVCLAAALGTTGAPAAAFADAEDASARAAASESAQGADSRAADVAATSEAASAAATPSEGASDGEAPGGAPAASAADQAGAVSAPATGSASSDASAPVEARDASGAGDPAAAAFSARAASVDGAAVAAAVKSELQAVRYDSDAMVDKLAPSRFSGAETLNKKLEIAKATGRPINAITDDEAKAALKQDNLQACSFGPSFARVQAQVDTLVPLLTAHSSAGAGAVDDYAAKILANKEAVLLGLAYLDRLYGFSAGSQPLYQAMLADPAAFGGSPDTDAVDWAIAIGNAGGDTLKLSNNLRAYAALVKGKAASAPNVPALLESVRDRFDAGADMNAWFKGASKAIVVEAPSANDPDAVAGLYDKLASDQALQAHLLPLLNVSENSMFAVSNAATITYGPVDTYVDRGLAATDAAGYAQKVAEFEESLNVAAREQAGFIDAWYRIATPDVCGKLESNRLVIDSLRKRGPAAGLASAEWSPRFGDAAALGVREFIAPMGKYAALTQADAQAEGSDVRMFLARAVEKDGLSAYTHELTHLLEDDVWFGGQTSRQGLDGEFFARGLFESYAGTDPIMNVNMVYEYAEGDDRLTNASPSRFQTADDLQVYMQGVMDVVYTLDYAEAQAALAAPAADKQRWFHKMEQQPDTRTRFNQGDPKATHRVDSVRAITADEAAALSTIDDLVDRDIVAARYEIDGLKNTGVSRSNSYYTVPLFTANYAAVQNDNGVSGDVMTRRYAHDLLAEYGYYGGLVPFVTNRYLPEAQAQGAVLSDAFVLPLITGGAYADMASFKKGMFHKRIDRVDELKPVTISYDGTQVSVPDYATLSALMKEAVAYDLANVHDTPNGWPNVRAQDTKVEQLKRAVYTAYLRDTDDFRGSIYREAANQAPVFADADLVLSVGDAFDPLTAVTVADPEDGPIALRPEHVVKNTVKTDVPGVYEVSYRVADSKGAVTEKTYTVTVNPEQAVLNHAPVITAPTSVTVVQGSVFDPLAGVSARDDEDGPIALSVADHVVKNTVKTDVPGTYEVTYRVSDSMGASATKTVQVTVEKTMVAPDPDPAPDPEQPPVEPGTPEGGSGDVETGSGAEGGAGDSSSSAQAPSSSDAGAQAAPKPASREAHAGQAALAQTNDAAPSFALVAGLVAVAAAVAGVVAVVLRRMRRRR